MSDPRDSKARRDEARADAAIESKKRKMAAMAARIRELEREIEFIRSQKPHIEINAAFEWMLDTAEAFISAVKIGIRPAAAPYGPVNIEGGIEIPDGRKEQ